jgi:uncharacterized protein (DUF2141 family)
LKQIKQIGLILGIFPFLSLNIQQDKKAKLTVEIKGVKNKKGKVLVAIYRRKDDFPKKEGRFLGAVIDAKDEKHVAVFENLPPDVYAIAAFHDENNNGIIDKNPFGIPTEVYGFSNNARNPFSAPSFESASFGIEHERKISILLK